MKMTGKVISFDGYIGKILGLDNKEYIMLKQDVFSNVKKDDIVMFEPEIFNDLELSKNIARFITIIKE